MNEPACRRHILEWPDSRSPNRGVRAVQTEISCKIVGAPTYVVMSAKGPVYSPEEIAAAHARE